MINKCESMTITRISRNEIETEERKIRKKSIDIIKDKHNATRETAKKIDKMIILINTETIN